MLEFIQLNLYLIYISLYLIFMVLSCDLVYWSYEQGYVHFKKKKNYKKVQEASIRSEYWHTEFNVIFIIMNFLPIINMFWYIYFIIHLMKNEYEFGTKFALQDICGWNKGLNSFIWKAWKPSQKWTDKYQTK